MRLMKKEKGGVNQAMFLSRTGNGRFDEKRVIVAIQDQL
jgi:hypothetical protein